ncbi:MAG: membrane dipeptidase [Actinobacteria bacterium]|nr:membrane dipeptidase [Actinomycetota bacterium]
MSDTANRTHTDEVYDSALVWDAHAGVYPDPGTDLSGLENWRQNGVSFVSINVAYDIPSWEQAFRVLAAYRRFIGSHPDRYLIAGTVDDVRRAKAEGRLAVAFDLEGMCALDGDLGMVALFHELGVRQALFAYNLNNEAGGGCHDEDTGLTDFGRAVVHEMNSVGMIVDCSHSAYRTTMEAMEISADPVVFSHSNARSMWDHERNIHDDQALACAATGGVVGVTGVGIFLGDNDSSTERLVEHICHYVDLLGPDHVGIGLDHVHVAFDLADEVSDRPDYWPPGQQYDTPGITFAHPEQAHGICEQLLARGLSDVEVTGILGGNFLRVAQQVWG